MDKYIYLIQAQIATRQEGLFAGVLWWWLMHLNFLALDRNVAYGSIFCCLSQGSVITKAGENG